MALRPGSAFGASGEFWLNRKQHADPISESGLTTRRSRTCARSAPSRSAVVRHRRLTPRNRSESPCYHADRRPICGFNNSRPTCDTDGAALGGCLRQVKFQEQSRMRGVGEHRHFVRSGKTLHARTLRLAICWRRYIVKLLWIESEVAIQRSLRCSKWGREDEGQGTPHPVNQGTPAKALPKAGAPLWRYDFRHFGAFSAFL